MKIKFKRISKKLNHNALWLIKIFIILISLILLIANLSLAKDYKEFVVKFSNISIEDGLSQSSVYSVFQDEYGFIWFGTEDGLNRYNGYDFTVYRNDPTNPNSLSSNWVYHITQDKEGNIWVATDGGVNKYDAESDNFTQYLTDPDDPESLSDTWNYYVYSGHYDYIWVGSDGGLNKLDKSTGKFTRYQHDPNDPQSISSNVVITVTDDPKNPDVLWVATDNGLNKLDKQTGKFTRYLHEPDNPNSLAGNDLWSVYAGNDGYLYVGCHSDGLSRIDTETMTFTNYRHNPNDPNSLLKGDVTIINEDKDGVMWVAVEQGGLAIFDRKEEKFVNFVADPANPYSISNNVVISIYEDKSGVLWVGTSAGGVNKFAKNKEKFNRIPANPDNPDAIVWSIYEDNQGYVWIGNRTGIDKYNRETKTYKHYGHDPDNPNTIAKYSTWAIQQDKLDEDILWLGTSTMLDRFNKRTETFTHFKNDPDDPTSITDGRVTTICQDKDGELWFGVRGGGVCKYNRETESFTRYLPDPDDPTTISSDVVAYIYEGSEGYLWIATSNGGLNRFDKKRNIFKSYTNDSNDLNSINDNQTRVIYETDDGTLWIGTNNGLKRFDKEKEQFTSYTVNDGLPNNVIYGLTGDSEGYLWMSTNQGLSKFDPKKETFRNYDVNDGLQSNEFNVASFFKNKDTGELFFGGINGISNFYPDNVKDNPNIPNVVITSFNKFNKEFKFDTPVWKVEEINLTPKDTFWGFEFASLDYNFPRKNQYRYKLQGFDEEWIDPGTRPYASYTNLGEGMYIFKVKGTNNDGKWNDVGTSIKIYIEPKPDVTPRTFSLPKLKTKVINLPYTQDDFTLEISGKDYSILDNEDLTYRLSGVDDEWISLKNNRYVHYTNTGVGRYNFILRDGESELINTRININPPFWQTPWFIVTSIVIGLALILAIYLIRVQSIRRYNKQLEHQVAVRTDELNKANHILKLQNDQMLQEMKMAERVQRSIIPNDSDFPKRNEITFGSNYSSMENIGGDLYDVIRAGKHSYGLLMVDVSGHGVPAALITTMVKVSFHSHTKYGVSTADVCDKVNRELFKFIGDLEYYLTGYYGILDLETGKFRFTNAGHHPALLWRKSGNGVEKLDSMGFFIGAFQDVNYEMESITLEVGDRLLLFTDGIIEARNEEDEFYEYERLLEYIERHSQEPTKDFVDGLIEDVNKFCGTRAPDDDRAILYIEYASRVSLDTKPEDAINIEARKVDRAETPFEEQAEENEFIRNAYGQALELIKEKKYEEALKILSDLNERHPENPKILHSLGVAYYKLGKLHDARRTLQNAISKDNKNELLKRNLAIVMRKLSELGKDEDEDEDE